MCSDDWICPCELRCDEMRAEEKMVNKDIYNSTRFNNPHIFQKQPVNRTTLRPRLQPVLLKRRRVDDDHRPFSIPWPITPSHVLSSSDESKSTNLQFFQKTPTTITPKSATLNPCHICHRRPTTRSVLDAYADCTLCGNRTCYICLRECLGPYCRALSTTLTGGEKRTKDYRGTEGEGEGRKICSTCAVEGVTEYGEDIVWCLECVERDRGAMETS